MNLCTAFKAFVHAEMLPPKRVVLFDENSRRYLFEGEAFVLLTPYLSQRIYSKDQILEHLAEKIPISEIYYALLRLQDSGFIEETLTKLPISIQAFCNLLEVPCDYAEKRLQSTFVSVKSFGATSVVSLKSALASMSIQLTEQEGAFSIVVTDNYRNPKLREHFLQSNIPYLLIRPTRSEIWVGPLFIPSQSPCLDCLLETLKKNSFEELFIEYETKRNTPLTISTPSSSTMSELAYNLTANEVFKWIVLGRNPDLEAKILSYHFRYPKIISHQVKKKFHCPHCGTVSIPEPKPLLLESQKKIFTEDGGHRIQSSEETYKNYEHLISPITGIIDFLIPAYSDQLTMMHTYKAAYEMRGHHFEGSMIDKQTRGSSCGKGKSAAQGKTSCLCEAIERYSGNYQGHEIRKKASYQALKDKAIHPNSLLLFSENQYKIREEWNQTCSPFHFIPAPFKEFEEIDWTPVWSITNNQFKYIPTAMCYFSYPFPVQANVFSRGDSNGSAAGNTKEEAILQGFFELVERDSIALWWYSRIQRPEVDLKSFPDPHIDRLISAYHRLDRKLWVIDITMDLNIPTFAAISCRNNENQGEILFGFGSHFDPSIALLRALTEMNQALLFLNATASLQMVSAKEETVRNWIEKEILSNHLYLVPNDSMKKKQRLNYPRFDTSDIKDDILECQKIIESKGLEMLVLDQTRADIGLPVVKVFVPGLRHFWNRFAPGRLYEVPLKLGLVKQKLTEEQMNPIPFFL